MGHVFGFCPERLLRHLELTVNPHSTEPKPGTTLRTVPTAQEMADAVGVTRRTLSRWQAGGQVQRWQADIIATRLGVYVTALFPDFHEVIDCTAHAERERLQLEREEAEGHFDLAPRRKRRVSRQRSQ